MKPNKFQKDILFNYCSLVLLASSGVLINFFILHTFGTAVLGQFNLIYAFYIVISQFSASGIHYSVLRSLSLTANQGRDVIRKIIVSALILVFFIGLLTGFFLQFLAPVVHYFYDDPLVLKGILKLTYAFPLFAMNKVLLAVFNGLRQMQLFAFGQFCRSLLMLSYALIVIFLKLEPSYLPSMFYFSEQCLFLILFPIIFFLVLKKKMDFSTAWVIHHLKFGMNAFLAGIFIEINSRVDVIILAAFVNSSLVGAYSFASMIAEGFIMILVVLRNNVNPILSQRLHENQYGELGEFMLTIRKYTYLAMTAIVLFTFMAYLYIINYFFSDQALLESWVVLLIISICLLLVSGYLPFSDFLIQANKPRLQSAQNILVVLANIFLSLLLTPMFGMMGAACAAGLSSYIISTLLIDWLAKKEGLPFLNLQKLKLEYAV